jgi:XRE family transcriptional regulator, regulator of sulfur utilization
MDQLQLVLSRNLKKIRDDRGLSLDKVASLTKVSKSMLGQIERGESNPTLSTVWKIANGLHISFTELIKEQQNQHEIIRKQDVLTIEEDKGLCRISPYFTYEDGRPYEVYKVDMEPSGYINAEPHPKGTIEIIVVYKGEVTVRIENREFTLYEGDATRFKGDEEHVYHNSGKTITKLGVVIYYYPE